MVMEFNAEFSTQCEQGYCLQQKWSQIISFQLLKVVEKCFVLVIRQWSLVYLDKGIGAIHLYDVKSCCRLFKSLIIQNLVNHNINN
jgi:hypothetical protein